ncbi:MAG: SpoIID/LytB domain-containing protein, partial [Lachnospiraceae bacterium]
MEQSKPQPISAGHVEITNTCFSSDPLIRVQISTVSGSLYHPDVHLCSSSVIQIVSDAGEDSIAPDHEMDIRSYFKEKSIKHCVVKSFSNTDLSDGIRLLSIQRGDENPVYPGELEIWYESDSDAFQIVNTVPMEQYLPGVVSSEMPSSFGLEALKAQAVCARSYAAASIKGESEVLSDTTADQVYRPCHLDDVVRTACEETRGEILTDENGTILKPHYYSTGWGRRADSGVFSKGKLTESDRANQTVVPASVSLTEAFPLTEQNTLDNPDAESPWHMWKCELSADSSLMQEKFEKEVQDIYVTERAESGYVTKIQVCFRDGTCADLSGASSIRSLLGSKDTVYTLSNGESRNNVRLLPSPYFTIQKEESSQ